VPDYGGKNESFQVAILQPPSALVYRSQRGHMQVSWSITLSVLPGSGARCAVAYSDLSAAPARLRPPQVAGQHRR